MTKTLIVGATLLAIAPGTLAGGGAIPLGLELGRSLSSVLPAALPGGAGGAVALAALTLVIGGQLVRRRR